MSAKKITYTKIFYTREVTDNSDEKVGPKCVISTPYIKEQLNDGGDELILSCDRLSHLFIGRWGNIVLGPNVDTPGRIQLFHDQASTAFQ